MGGEVVRVPARFLRGPGVVLVSRSVLAAVAAGRVVLVLVPAGPCRALVVPFGRRAPLWALGGVVWLSAAGVSFWCFVPDRRRAAWLF